MKAKNTLKLLTALTLAVTTAVTATAAFSKSKTYNGSFTDVAENAWYAKEVASAYELGFMDGMSDTIFSPATTVTVAQGITMASRVHAVYNGKTIAEVKGEWYDMYVKYAKENGIIDENQFDSYTRQLKRYEMAELFYDAMPAGYYKAINDVDYIPDVPVGAMYGEKLLELYNAGIVMGNDDYGTFNPDSSIVRSECAAIINRVAIPENRKTGELLPFTSENAYTLVYNTTLEGEVEGINSGWVLDNRGGDAKTSLTNFGTLKDVNENYATRLIREFNFIPKGEIVLDTQVVTASNGAYVEYKDVKGNTVYMIKIVNGQWNILGKDGKFTPIAPNNKPTEEKNLTLLRVSVNLDTGKSTTFINDEACGTHDLLSDNVMSFVAGIDEKGTGVVKMSYVNMVVNYNMYEDFEYFGAEQVYGWKTTGDVTKDSKQLNLSADSSAVKTFKAADGTVCAETYFYSKDGADFDVAVGNILTVKSAGKKLYAQDTELHTLTPDMWYRLRVEADTAKGTAKVFLNGMLKAQVKLSKNEAVSTLGFSAKGNVSFDYVKVYELHEYADYVPVPETKASADDYTVGLNICSLWRNGTHYGWACITPYDEPSPVLGYYDEGLPETADWEIKYMVDHGIDFQAFCWYTDVVEGALKHPRQSEQLHNGFQYAKYSDYMKYCLILETKGSKAFDSEQFRNYIIPYWFENYFTDSRYLTIENKLVLAVFVPETLADANHFGSPEAVKAELEYLEEQAKKYGFDGALFFCNNTSSDKFAAMGFDASFAYNWSTAGSSVEVNKSRITASSNNKNMYTIPTISVGFDSIPWHGERYPLMTVENYGKAMRWVKDSYLPSQAKKQPSWAKGLVWLSTWNEYGEGTYISPAGLNGFGYLDKLRTAFTNLGEDHTDVVPTLKQKERITHLYPQYARLLRRGGWYKYNETAETRKDAPQSRLYVNEKDISSSSFSEIPPMLENGKIYHPFEPATGVNYIMNIHYEWRKAAGTLLIEGNGHSVKMLVGSDRYIKDGKEADLGYTLKLVDNIPMLDFKKLSDDLGYTYEEIGSDLHIYTETYKDLWEKFTFRETGTYEFNSGDSEGWASGNMNVKVGDGFITMENNGPSMDPISYLSKDNFPRDFITAKFSSVELRVRYKYDGASNHQVCFYFTTDVDSKWNEAKSYKKHLSSKDSGDEWETITIDLTQNPNWALANKLTALRFDPFNALGSMDIDYIRFIEDPNYVPEPPKQLPTAIVNGDAQGEEVLFNSHNATVTKIADPHKKGNYVWFVNPRDGKQWTYIKHPFKFTKGSTYLIDFDIKIIGNNADIASFTETSYCVNLKYPDRGATNDIDHFVAQNVGISIADGWVHYSGQYTVSKVDWDEDCEFTIYVNPKDDASFEYYIDNLVVREKGAEGWDKVEIVKNDNPEGSIIIPGSMDDKDLPPVKKGVITVNGSADESDETVVYSTNSEISIVEDPDNPKNKVFFVMPDLGKKWSYFRYPYKDIRKGVTYKISYDIKFAGNNENDSTVTKSQFTTNIVYNQAGAKNGFDHPQTAKPFSVADGWVHCEVTHTVTSIIDNEASCFAVYVDPVGDASISYYIDNFKVEIVGGDNVID